jgi:hypothetical protein
MKNRNWSKTSLWVASVAVALALLIFMSTAHSKRTESRLRVKQGQEIALDDKLKIVVGKIEDGQAEISIYRNSESAQPLPSPNDNKGDTDPCAGCCGDPIKPGKKIP